MVWSGTLPSRYCSVRAISDPPRRPEQRTLMPSAPCSMAICTDFFMARRKPMRRSSCPAMLSATSCASVSGERISWMSILTCLSPLIAETSLVMFSISEPLRPMTSPGRAVKMVTRRLFQARSITIFETAAWRSLPLRYSRILRSACRWSANSRRGAYHFDPQSREMGRRKPIG